MVLDSVAIGATVSGVKQGVKVLLMASQKRKQIDFFEGLGECFWIFLEAVDLYGAANVRALDEFPDRRGISGNSHPHVPENERFRSGFSQPLADSRRPEEDQLRLGSGSNRRMHGLVIQWIA
jgi:hypothetical protein